MIRMKISIGSRSSMEVLFVPRGVKSIGSISYIFSKVKASSESRAVKPGRVSSEKVDVAAGLVGGEAPLHEVIVVRLVPGLSKRVFPENTEEGLREDGPGHPLRDLLGSSKYGGLG